MSDDLIEDGTNNLIIEAIEEHWGERCPDFQDGCPTCEVWKQLDALASKDKALEEMRAERDDAIATVKLLQQQFKQQNDHDTALLERMADCLDCARMDWEVNNGEIINKADPHWTVEARRLCAARAQAEGETP